MLSLRHFAECLDLEPDFSVLRDFWGFQGGVPPLDRTPSQVSLRRQMERLRDGAHVNLNIIRAGTWSATQRDDMDAAIHKCRQIYWQGFITIGRVEYYSVPTAELNGNDIIEGRSEVEALTQAWSIPNDGIDCFIPTSAVFGLSPVPGTCVKGMAAKDGILVPIAAAFQNPPWTTTAQVARTFAHELGHYLGLLGHHDRTDNLMHQSAGEDVHLETSVELDAFQIAHINRHCAVHGAC